MKQLKQLKHQPKDSNWLLLRRLPAESYEVVIGQQQVA